MRRHALRARVLAACTSCLAGTTGHAAPPEPPAASGDQVASDTDGDDPDAPPPAPTPDARAPTKPKRIEDGMVFAEGGTFVMGSSEKNAPANERPPHELALAPFWIDRTEVTVAAYRACVERGACARPVRSSPSCTYDLGEPELPVSCVPWSSAETFCLAAGKRLPREAEWEYAARATGTARYPWGGAGTGCGLATTLLRDASQRGCSKRPTKVGSHPLGASPVGALDMSGNVEEWVADWYAETASDRPPGAGSSHVLRGGGFLSMPSLSRVTSRNWGSSREAGPNVGFRCARDESPKKPAR